MPVQFSRENLKSFIIFPSLVPGNSMSLSFQTDTPGQTKKHYANMPVLYAAIFKGGKNDNF